MSGQDRRILLGEAAEFVFRTISHGPLVAGLIMIGAAEAEAAKPRLKVPIYVNDNGGRLIRGEFGARSRVFLDQALASMASSEGVAYVTGRRRRPYRTTSGKPVHGKQLWCIGDWWNSDNDPRPGGPSKPLHWWTPLIGPSEGLNLQGVRYPIPPEALVSPSYVLLGPRASITTTRLTPFVLSDGSLTDPQIVVLYTHPDNPRIEQ